MNILTWKLLCKTHIFTLRQLHEHCVSGITSRYWKHPGRQDKPFTPFVPRVLSMYTLKKKKTPCLFICKFWNDQRQHSNGLFQRILKFANKKVGSFFFLASVYVMHKLFLMLGIDIWDFRKVRINIIK